MTDNPAPAVNTHPEARPAAQQTVPVPVGMLYGSDLPQTVRFTWLQLYGLAGRLPDGQLQTPPLRLKEIARLTGKGLTAIYNHLAVLRSTGLIGQQNLCDGRVLITFADSDGSISPERSVEREYDPDSEGAANSIGAHQSSDAADISQRQTSQVSPPDIENTHRAIAADPADTNVPLPAPAEPETNHTSFHNSGFHVSGFKESEISPSLKYLKDIKNHIIKHKKREADYHDSGILESEKSDAESSSRLSPIAIYHELTGLHLNKVQRKMLLDQVSDAQLWRESVSHWLGHHWNPFNIPGMLDLYRRGGPDECLLCKPGSNHGALPEAPPGEDEPAADPIENLRRRHGLA